MSVRLAHVGDPRFIVSMEVLSQDRYFRIGANSHYTLDTPLVEALAHFFTGLAARQEQVVIDITRSRLKIEYMDMPTVTSVDLSSVIPTPPTR